MTEVELNALAEKVAEKLRGPMISTALPAAVGELLREAARHGQWRYTMLVPLHNGYGINADWMISPDGSLSLRMMDVGGQLFWQGTFRAVEETKL